MDKADSPIWNSLLPRRGKTKTGGTGKKKCCYEWDYTHNDIEVYNYRGEHPGAADAFTGKIKKPPVPGRKINV
jgi:hypothetical protein